MTDRQFHGLAADSREAARGAPVQLELRRTAGLADDLDVTPENALRMAGAERLHRRFLRREPSGEMNRRLVTAHAVGDLAVGENATGEAVAVAADGRGNARDLRRVESESDNGHASQA